MAEKNKKIKLSQDDFIRYQKDLMTGEERNLFEKELQKDPFSEEALEGLEIIEPEERDTDIEHLRYRIIKRGKGKKKYLFFRIAASIAVIMVISTIFIIYERSNHGMKQDNILAKEESSGSSNKAPIAVREIPERPDENSSLSQNTVQEDTGIIDDGNKEDIISGIKDMAVAMNTSPDTFTRSSPVITARTIQPEKREPIPAAKAYKSIEPPSPLPGDTISSVTVNTITAAASVSAREETIYTTDFPDTNRYFYIADITGSYPYESGIEHDFQSNVNPDPLIEEFSEKGRTDLRKGIDNMKIETNYVSYLPPEPAIGEKGFDRYIRENIRYPEPVTDTIILYPSVALKFLVHKNGVIDSIRVIRSPAKRFSAEAVRLIESGPSWKPAEEDGRMIDEEVTVVIEFRK